MKNLEIICPSFNEELNIQSFYNELISAIKSIDQKINVSITFVDNNSSDNTINIIKKIIDNDPRAKLIVNARNYGHIRSPMSILVNSTADAAIIIATDLQDPPNLIPLFISKWFDGYKIVVGVKKDSDEGFFIKNIRKFYYYFLSKISDKKIIKNFMGYGLYDSDVIRYVNNLNDPYPFFRGLLSEIGYPIYEIPYKKPMRLTGTSSNNFLTLIDMAMIGIVHGSYLPLRIMIVFGFFISISSFLFLIIFLILKFLYWDAFSMGVIPILLFILFFFGITFFFLGLISEYLIRILILTEKKPLTVQSYKYPPTDD